jgi:hypothetical protein
MSRKGKKVYHFLGEEAWGFRPASQDGGSQGRSPYRREKRSLLPHSYAYFLITR